MDKEKIKKEIKEKLGANFVLAKLVRIILVILLIILMLIVKGNIAVNFDNVIYVFVSKFITLDMTSFMIFITTLGSNSVLPIIAVVIVILLLRKDKKEHALVLSMNLVLSVISYLILKNIIQRPRPEGYRLVDETGFSFPSGHTTNNVAFYGLIIYFVYKNVKNKVARNIIVALLIIYSLLIGISRIYLGVHYPTDVIAGILLGIIIVITSVLIYEERIKGKITLK